MIRAAGLLRAQIPWHYAITVCHETGRYTHRGYVDLPLLLTMARKNGGMGWLSLCSHHFPTTGKSPA